MGKAINKTPLVNLLRFVVGVLVLIAVGELTILTLMPMWGHKVDSPDGVEVDVVLQPIQPMLSINEFQETIDRSLFNRDRRPVTSEKVIVGEEILKSRWQLSGIVGDGQKKYAIFADKSSVERLKLEVGMYLDKWKVSAIKPTLVKLERDGEEEVFYLEIVTAVPSSAVVKNTHKRLRDIDDEEDERD